MSVLEIISRLLTVDVAIGLGIGVIGGMIIGILPGLGATMAIALMIPMTFGWDPVASLVLLCSTYTAATFGGSISAILLHTPGTPSSAATAQDGYELTKQGRGLEAIGMSAVSSLFGGLVGGFALLLIAPPLAQAALKFSSPEYFFIAIFGITIIGSLAGNDPLRGMISGAFGLLIGLVGMEQNTAYVRYSFGIMELQGGFSLVPVMIGMFSVSQVLVQVERLAIPGGLDKGQVMDDSVEISGKFLPKGKELVSYFPLMLRASILGTFIGILPGAGGDIGSWVGYNEAIRSSKNKKLFGHGSLEGVCGSEAANNAVCGGAYIPLLTLGIPGSGAAAVLMGGLLIHGLQPGTSLFTQHADVVYPIICGYIISNILMAIVGVACAKQLVKVAAVPMNVLIPLIIVLAFIGGYAINMSMFDVYVSIFFGVVGYLMRKAKIPTAPAVLALILGPMAERALFASTQMTKGVPLIAFFLSRPLCVLFILLIIISICAPLYMSYRRKKKGLTDGGSGIPESDD